MLICMSLLAFFVALIVPVVWVKPSRKTSATSSAKKIADADSRIVLRKQREMSLSKELVDDDDTGGFLAPASSHSPSSASISREHAALV